MLPFDARSPADIAKELARRVKALRLRRGWTQQEIAARAGIALPTYRRFEKTGQISLDRLLWLAVVLDARSGFEGLFPAPRAGSIAELERSSQAPKRQRGKRRDAEA